MSFTEKQVSRETKFVGRVFTVHVDKIEISNGVAAEREIVEHRGGVAVLPVDEEGFAWCVKQFRYPFGAELLEIPAGKLEAGEDPAECALRELGEETGLECAELIPLGVIYPSPGYAMEKLWLYLALGLTRGESHPDPDEFLDVLRVPFDELLEKCTAGEVNDAKTVAAVFRAQSRI